MLEMKEEDTEAEIARDYLDVWTNVEDQGFWRHCTSMYDKD